MLLYLAVLHGIMGMLRTGHAGPTSSNGCISVAQMFVAPGLSVPAAVIVCVREAGTVEGF